MRVEVVDAVSRSSRAAPSSRRRWRERRRSERTDAGGESIDDNHDRI